ncbi:MAG: response regulator [Lachnospiraceae bacterium]|nr:response regulator [Lachnospiraceae bacterium]
MIQIMIVDDMPIFLDYLRNCIDWNAYGFEICCEAHDGKEALEKLEQYYPDVVLTDITMPYLNGLELSEKITRDYPDISIILITGNNEFEYARKAVKIGVCDYIVKPFEKEELILSLLKLQDNIGKAVENEESGNASDLQEDLRALIYAGQINDRLFTAPSEENRLLLSLVRFGSSQERREYRPTMEEMMNWEKLVARLLGDKLEIDGEFRIFHDFENNIVVLMNFAKASDAESYKGYEFTDIIGIIKHQLSLECAIAMTRAENLSSVKNAYEKALNELSGKPLGSLYDLRHLDPDREQASLNDIYRLNRDIETLRLADAEETIRTMASSPDHKLLLSSAVSVLMTNSIHSGYSIEKVFGADFSPEQYLEQAASQEEMCRLVIDLYTRRMELEKKKTQSKDRDVALAVKAYIDENYSRPDLSIPDISNAIGMNQTYIRKMFKSELAMTLTEYITKVRMEQARIILKETDEKLTAVAEMVGYSDVSYFSNVFKKYYGTSPRSLL